MVYETIKKFVKAGDVLANPKSGTSTILKIDENEIIYKRGKSSLHIRAEDINSAYDHFKDNLYRHQTQQNLILTSLKKNTAAMQVFS